MAIKSAVILEDEPGFMMSPDMPNVPSFKTWMNHCTPGHFWQWGGKVPIVEVTNEAEIEKRYFRVPFYFLNPKTGNSTLIEDSLAQVASAIVRRKWGTVTRFEEV